MGIIAMVDPPRAGVADSIAVLQNSKVKVIMITGDAEATASSICRILGIRYTIQYNYLTLLTRICTTLSVT